MRQQLHLVLALAAITAGLAGCSTSVHVANLDPDEKAGVPVNGIPFRTKERYQLKLYRLVGGKYVPVEINETTASLANQDQLYVMHMKGSPLSDGTVQVKVQADNTLSFLSVTSQPKPQEIATELGKAGKSIADAQAARDTARTAAEKSSGTAVVATEDALLAKLDAERDAQLAQLELEALAADASALDRTKAEHKVTRARVVANQMARRAGLPLPFPTAGT
jgi:hypothetical protein